MTQSNESNDRSREIDRQFRNLRRRTEHLEYLQIPPQEFSRSFDRVCDKINDLKATMNKRFDRI